ncbi:hypothetical protein GCM10027425_19930 [Alteromonas gracilis]
MSTIGAKFPQVEMTHQHLVQTVAQMNQQLEDLKSYLKPMVATWSGEASANYQALQAKWDTSAAELNQTLARIGSALEEGKNNLQAREKSNAARF